mgnify:CR=1 FL=1
MSSSGLPSVQRLVGLARSNGIDVRPTLLRVLVDQFVAEPGHPAAEVTRFGELVLNLLPRASETDRAIVAAKLARHRQTPTAVARRLAGDVASVACPVLAHSGALSDDDLFLAVRSGDIAKALAVAEREDIGLAALVALEEIDDPAVRAALAARIGRAPPPPRSTRPDRPADLGQRFLAGTASRREAIIAELAVAQAPLPAGAGARLAETGQGLEVAALSRRPHALAEAVGRAFGLDADMARRVAEDEGGEPLVVCARVLDLGPQACTRILLFAHEAIGTSVERIYDLSALYEAMPRTAAVTILRAWQAAAPAKPQETQQRAARHQPVYAQDASDRTGARQAASAQGRAAPRAPASRPAGGRNAKGS